MFVRLSKYATVLEQLDKANERIEVVVGLAEDLERVVKGYRISNSKVNRQLVDLTVENSVLTSQVNNLTSAYAELRARELQRGMVNNTGSKPNQVKGFTDDELKSLIQLIHPDKHGGKEANVRMLQIINNLRNN